jgi:hypothetical protein
LLTAANKKRLITNKFTDMKKKLKMIFICLLGIVAFIAALWLSSKLGIELCFPKG